MKVAVWFSKVLKASKP